MLLPITLTDNAYDQMRKYFFDNPTTFQHELESTGIDPLRYPETFIQYELMTQPKHADIRQLVEAKDGLVSSKEIAMWIRENIEEIADFHRSHKFVSYSASQKWQPEFYTGQILLSDAAEGQLLDYFRDHPQHRLYELDEHRVDPILASNIFFRSEITTEVWHNTILHRVKAANGHVTPDIVRAWIAEEMAMGE